MKKKFISLVMIFSIVCISLLTGCDSKSSSILPEKVAEKAMQADKNIKTYYVEGKMQMYDNNKKMSEESMKIWNDYSKGKMRIRVEGKTDDKETISTNDGKKVIMYNKKDNTALVMDALDSANMQAETPKQTFINLMENMKDSYDVTTEKEEKVNGFNCIHISAKSKQKNCITGDMDFWIDKETWFVIKSKTEASNTKIIFEITKLDTKVKMEDSLFTQKLASDVKVKDIKDLKMKEKKLTLKQASEILKSKILYVPKTSEYKLTGVTQIHPDNKDLPIEIEQKYEKNGKEAFIISVVIPKVKSDDAVLPGEKEIKVRGKKGSIMEGSIPIVTWQENGLNYAAIVSNPEISSKEIQKIVENMK